MKEGFDATSAERSRTSQMRVVFDYQVFSNNGKSGISRYFVELASRLCRFTGIDAKIVAPLSRSPFLSEYRSRIPTVGIDLVGLPIARGLPDRPLRFINQVLFREYSRFANADIVHETYFAMQPCTPKGAKTVTTVHDTIPERVPELYSNLTSYHAERQKVIRRADWIICVSGSTRSDLLELYDVDPARVSVVPLASSLCASNQPPMRLGLPYFLHVGNRYPHKNFNLIVRAFGQANLYKTHKLVSFTGSAWAKEELAEMRQANVPEAAMISVGGDDSLLARFYAGADALVFPSLYEGFGIPLVEAMRLDCPIITSNISSLPEVAGDAAIYVDPRDSDAIASALVQVASCAETRSRLIAKGRAQARRFSWDRCALETYEVYSRLLGR